MRSYDPKQFEQSLKLTDKQKQWLEKFLEAKRDYESERLYETQVTTIKIRGVWRQFHL